VRASSNIEWLKEQQHPKWTGLESIVAVMASREYNDKITIETAENILENEYSFDKVHTKSAF